MLTGALLASLVASLGSASNAFAQPAFDPTPSISVGVSDVVALGNFTSEIESDAPVSLRSAADSSALATLFSELSAEASDLNLRPQNLGPSVNSRGTELGPVIAPDGRTLFFTRGSSGNQDIWYSRVDSAGGWSPAVRMPSPLTNAYNNFVESVTPDGNTLLVGGRYNATTKMVTGLAMSHRTLDGWSVPEPLRIRNYYSRSRSVSSCLGSDGQTIVMSLEREDGCGRQDLYVSFQTGDGEWSEPLSLGPNVNSDEIDFAPFLAADGVTLYFSSKGYRGYGDADIYVTRRLDSTWQRWTTPQNLGPAINSGKWDAYYVIPASGEYVYFGSVNDAIGESDLVRIGLPKAVRPQAVALVSGRVVDSRTKQPVEATIRYERLPGGQDAGVARTDPATGAYTIALPAGETYAFRAEAPGFLGVGSNVDLKALDRFEERRQDLEVVPFELGETFGLANIFFDFAQSGLRVESFPELDRLADVMRAYPSVEIEIEGHTDYVGTLSANVKLSEERVASVVKYLEHSGIDICRLHTLRRGEAKPIAPNVTDEGRQRNRRVEFRIIRR